VLEYEMRMSPEYKQNINIPIVFSVLGIWRFHAV
jgi:hypothetical protein